MPGPPPQPAKLRLLKGRGPGTDVAGRKVRPQPQVVAHLPEEPPEHLPDHAAEMWQRVVPELVRMTIGGNVDVAVLEAFCMAYETMRRADEQVAADGMVSVGSLGQPVAHPMLGVASKARAQIGTLGSQLGLTPAARLRMTLPEVTDDEEEAVFGRRDSR